MRPAHLKSYKGETFGVDPEIIERRMKSAVELDLPWVILEQLPDEQMREIWDNLDWYNPDLSLRNTPNTRVYLTGLEEDVEAVHQMGLKKAQQESTPKISLVDRQRN